MFIPAPLLAAADQ